LSNEELEQEQRYVTRLYDRLDDLRERAARRLKGVLAQSGGTHQARSEREVFSVMYGQQLAQFDAAEHGLVFGRLEFDSGERRYIGRLGIHSDGDDYRQLLMDWRADAARPFYLATAVSPGGVKVRRHIKTRSRQLVSLDDEVLDLAVADPSRHEGLTGEAALMAALSASRTGTMGDIVETIQVEQDKIIRAPLGGALVVQGGPGTGKTAVALHRAAYLLYTHRRQLEKRGVLVVGPNATFLRYIGQVLPSLGETSVLLGTVAELFPGISATAAEPAAAAEIKGRIEMAALIAVAVKDRQKVPEAPVEIAADAGEVRLLPRAAATARERARRSRRPHNQARAIFAREIVNALTRQLAGRLGANALGGENLLGEQEVDDLRRELRADPAVRAVINRLWPTLTPQQLLSDLYRSPELLARAAPKLSRADRAALRRDPDQGWTAADVPLLDEAAELLGADDRTIQAERERQRQIQRAYAQGVLDIIGRDDEDDPDLLMGADIVSATELAARYEEELHMTPAERAATDRTWAFGHIIVDEAQELSEMAWRLLMRRCPVKSMTIVGDVAQTSDLAGPGSWQQALDRYLGDRWRLAPLTVNYRTPAEVMAVAADVLAEIDPALEPPRSVRESGHQPWRLAAEPSALVPTAVSAAVHLAEQTGDGKLAVIGTAAKIAELSEALTAALPEVAVGEDPDLTSPVVVLTVRQAKGLEFDSVLIADPAGLLAESPRGLNDLYVALTRATQRVGVVHEGPIPAVLTGLTPHQPANAAP
jgi:DNA helicase IV